MYRHIYRYSCRMAKIAAQVEKKINLSRQIYYLQLIFFCCKQLKV